MRHFLAAALAASAVACSASSSSPSSDAPVNIDVARSSLARDTSPNVSDADKAIFANDQAGFAVDLFHTVVAAAPDQDVFVSPYSVASAFAMTYAGAKDTTAAEMRKTLHFTQPDATIHAAFDAADLALASRNGEGLKINVVNATFGQKGYTFLSPFLDTLAVSYGAGMNLLDFKASPDPSRLTINKWVEQQTNDRIKDLLPQNAITDLTRLVLVNAVHLDAEWVYPFAKEATAPATFTTLSGTTSVSMMAGGGSLPYAQGDGWQAVGLPYKGGSLEMVVLLPAAGSFTTFESQLTGDKLLTIADALAPKLVNLWLPKAKLDSNVKLKDALQTMGMNIPFDQDRANFRGIADDDLHISDAFHKTFVAIDEKGTEAAAATAVVVGEPTSMPVDPPVDFRADRPYVAAILDAQTHTILFLGRVTSPKE